MEVRGGDYGAHYGTGHCPGCGVGLMTGERCSIPDCPEAKRAARRQPARNLTGREAVRSMTSGGTLTGAEALRAMGGGNMTGRSAVDHLDRQDQLHRNADDLELLDCYARALGLPLGGVGHEPGWPS